MNTIFSVQARFYQLMHFYVAIFDFAMAGGKIVSYRTNIVH
jgi:hypothetical protein